VPFTFRHLEIPEIVVVESQRYADTRGSFFESYKQSAFAANGLQGAFVQDNCSHSVRNVLRGLHYQKHPVAQGKLVLVAAGEIFDVAVDIRKGSPTFGRWTGARLVTSHMIYVPIGFAHGFCVVSDEATVLYKTTAEYNPEFDRGIIWNDPTLAIDWPVKEPLLSDKDRRLPTLDQADNNFVYSP